MKKKTYFDDGEVAVISSSHNDIAYLDTPLVTILFRNKNIIKKAIEMLEKDPKFRYSIENSLYIKDYLALCDEGDKKRIEKLLLEGRLAIGATNTQPYETHMTSEALVRQYYLGKRWLRNEFGNYDSKTTWNQDVPARTMQSAQIMKKCNVDYLFVSRMNAGFFKWYSPDGSFVTGYSTGHYHSNSITHIIDVKYNVYDQHTVEDKGNVDEDSNIDKEGHQKIFNYLEEAAKTKYEATNTPPLFGFLSIRDYDIPLNLNSYFDTFSKNTELQLPYTYHSTAEEFMSKALNLLDEDKYWDEYHGERPNLWLYHEPSHSDAFKYMRRGMNLIEDVESLNLIEKLLNLKNYQTSKINDIWENLLYTDHGWGGCNGHVTDRTYLAAVHKGYSKAKKLKKKLLKTLSDNIEVTTEKNNITIFNPSCHEREDRVYTQINWKKLGTIDFEIFDENGNVVDYQIIKEPSPYHIDIVFIAKVPSLGYLQYSIRKSEKVKRNKQNVIVDSIHKITIDNNFYHLVLEDGGFTEIFDKEIGDDILNPERLLKGFEIFMINSNGSGSGEFSQIQMADDFHGLSFSKYNVMTGVADSSSNMNMVWSVKEDEGLNNPSDNVVTIIEGEAHFRDFTLLQTIKVFNKIKKIETNVKIEAFSGSMFKEIRMSLPLKHEYQSLKYEVPMGILELGKDEVQGVIGDKPFIKNTAKNIPTIIYPDDCREIHPREVGSWIACESDKASVLFSCPDTPTFDYKDLLRTWNPKGYSIQPILLSSRHSCYIEMGPPYHQRGDHEFNFALSSNLGSLKDNIRLIEDEKKPLTCNINYNEEKRSGLVKKDSFIDVKGNVNICSIKKCEDTEEMMIRLYESFGNEEEVKVSFKDYIESVRKSDMLEYGGEKIKTKQIMDKVKPYNIETYCMELKK